MKFKSIVDPGFPKNFQNTAEVIYALGRKSFVFRTIRSFVYSRYKTAILPEQT